MERQLEVEIDLTKYRMYDYALGRFLNVDPLADQAGQESYTPYHYSLNNPVRYNDPYGDCVGDLPCPQALRDVKKGAEQLGKMIKTNLENVLNWGDESVEGEETDTRTQEYTDRGGEELYKTEGTNGSASTVGKPTRGNDITDITDSKAMDRGGSDGSKNPSSFTEKIKEATQNIIEAATGTAGLISTKKT